MPQSNGDFMDSAGFAGAMPVLLLGVEKSGGEFLISQGRMVATNVDGVIIT